MRILLVSEHAVFTKFIDLTFLKLNSSKARQELNSAQAVKVDLTLSTVINKFKFYCRLKSIATVMLDYFQ